MGAGEAKTKEGRKLIKNYQKKHKSLTVSKDARHMSRLFTLYGGKKGYLDYNEATAFVKDVLIVCELMDQLDDPDTIISGIVRELDPNSTNRIYLSELLKPSWGKVQDVIHRVAGKMGTLKLSRAPPGNLVVSPLKSPSPSQTNLIFPGAKIIKDENSSLSQSDLEENCPPSFICPISTEMMNDPVMLLETGATYERKCIEEWLQNHETDPSTGLHINSKDIVGVLALRNAIEEWTEDINKKQKERKERREKKLQKNSQPTEGSALKDSHHESISFPSPNLSESSDNLEQGIVNNVPENE